MYFLSDGRGTGSFGDELTMLEADHQGKITAVGIGDDADLPLLELIDNTGSADRVTSAEQLDASLLGFPRPRGQVLAVDVFVNGRRIPGVERDDLITTPGPCPFQRIPSFETLMHMRPLERRHSPSRPSLVQATSPGFDTWRAELLR